MKKINLNKLAKTIALNEDGEEEVSIAQIKEIMGLLFWELANCYEPSEVFEAIERYKEEF